MSQPKKKTSRSRRDIRRYSSHKKDHGVAWTTGPGNQTVRCHTVTMETIDAYLESRNSRAKSTSSKSGARA